MDSFFFAHCLLFWFLATFYLQTIDFCFCSSDGVPGSVRSACMKEERQALLSFRHDLADPSGRLSSWTEMSPWSWELWDEVAYRRSLLRGKTNPSFLSLKHLDYLDRSCNDFRLPLFISQLKSLRYLNLSAFSSSEGVIPESIWNLSSSKFLQYFDGIRIPKFFGHLKSLQFLDMSFSSFEITSNLANLSNLIYLDFGGNFWSIKTSKNLNWFSQLSFLKYLNLQCVDLSRSGDSWLVAANMLPSLLELHVSSCEIEHFPLSLPKINITSLLILDMSQDLIVSNFFGGSIARELGSLKDLEELDLSINGFDGQVPRLTRNLANNNFVGGLQELLDGCVGCTNDKLESVDLSLNRLHCKFPASLGMLQNLQYLNLESNTVWGTISEFIGNLSSLETIKP
ncbi:putative transferase [Rosa chinensis]|uniref:Putative transferase n=1 Tax=Rosa chinensis TaxID=74649 RepID=A0A2P6Q7S8_ROSCH|nr:putative transferase [Rosa chinensis]